MNESANKHFHRRSATVRGIVIVACAWAFMWSAGCDPKPPKPKYKDNEAAHARRYHPAVRRTDAAATAPAETPTETSELLPTDFNFEPGTVGCPVLFVNGQTLTVSEILEPIFNDLTAKAQSLSVPAYRNHLMREVHRQIDYQMSIAVLYEEAQHAYAEDRYEEAFGKEADRIVHDVMNREFGGVEPRYEAHLKRFDLSLEDVKERTKRQLMVMQFLRDRFSPLTSDPTRRELIHYYQTHKDTFTSPAKAELWLLEIPLETELGKPVAQASTEEIAGAKTAAREQLSRAKKDLDAGKDFAEVARQYSKGVRAKTGGNWGEISEGSLAGRWEKVGQVLFSLKAGETSPITETDKSLFVVRCGKKTVAYTTPFEDAQEQITKQLADEDFNRRRDAYVGKLLAKADVQKRSEFFQAVLAASPRPASLSASSVR